MKNNIPVYRIEFDFKEKSLNAEMVTIDKDNILESAYKLIGCRMIDIVYLDDKALIIDDEGLLVAGNGVLQFGDNVQLAGTILIANSVMTDEGMDIDGITSYSEVDEFLTDNPLRIIGVTD